VSYLLIGSGIPGGPTRAFCESQGVCLNRIGEFGFLSLAIAGIALLHELESYTDAIRGGSRMHSPYWRADFSIGWHAHAVGSCLFNWCHGQVGATVPLPSVTGFNGAQPRSPALIHAATMVTAAFSWSRAFAAV